MSVVVDHQVLSRAVAADGYPHEHLWHRELDATDPDDAVEAMDELLFGGESDTSAVSVVIGTLLGEDSGAGTNPEGYNMVISARVTGTVRTPLGSDTTKPTG